MFFINKKCSVLFLSLMFLICSSSVECKSKQFIRQSPSLLSKVSDVALCSIATVYGYYGTKFLFTAINSDDFSQNNCNKSLSCFVRASIALSLLYLKSQWSSKIYEEVA